MLKCSLGKVHWDTIKEGPYPLFREYVAFENTGRFLGFRSTIIIVAFAYGNVHNGGGNPQLTSMPRASKRIVMLCAFFAGSNR